MCCVSVSVLQPVKRLLLLHPNANVSLAVGTQLEVIVERRLHFHRLPLSLGQRLVN